MYPRKNAPLVPPGLRLILGDAPVPPQIVVLHKLPRGLKLGDLDSQVWHDFPRASVDALAEAVVGATSESFPEILASEDRVPIDPSGEGLSLRAHNALFRAGLLGTAGRKEVPLGVLAGERQVGAKTLLEILAAGSAAEDDTEARPRSSGERRRPKQTQSRAVKKAAESLRRRRWAAHIRASDPRLGALLGALSPGATSAREAAEGLIGDRFSPGAARVKVREIREFLKEAERLRHIPLEEELDQLIEAIVKGSSQGRAGLKARLGLGGSPPTTLARAGETAGLTRERVRQIELAFIDGVRDTNPWTPVLDKVLAALSVEPARVADAQVGLRALGLLRSDLPITSILSAAAAFGPEADVELDREAGVVRRAGSGISMPQVASEARRLTTHWGAATLDTLCEELQVGGATVDRALVRLLLESVPNLRWLDDEEDWFWIQGTSRNRLLNQVEKIIAVAGSLDIAELREGVGRFYRMDGFRPPREVLARLCVQAGLCVRDGNTMIEGPSVPAWEVALRSTVERTLAEVLLEHGPVMRRDDLEAIAVDERGVNRSSFYVYLGYSPILARFAPGVYGLRGARVSAAEVNALIPPRAHTQRLLDHGWTSDGRVWIGYKISAAALTAGVLSVPSALQSFVKGAYLLFSEQERPVGTLKVRGGHMWGVGPFYRRWGVEEGDHVVVTIDINTRRATILSGGEEVLLRFQEAE